MVLESNIRMKKLGNRYLHLRFILKLWKPDGKVKWWHTTKIRRIRSILKADVFQNSMEKAYLKVWYGKAVTNIGRVEDIVNEGDYESLDELKQALSAFTEKSLLDDTDKWIQRV